MGPLTLNDRVALILGRTIIRAEELAVENEQSRKRIEELEHTLKVRDESVNAT